MESRDRSKRSKNGWIDTRKTGNSGDWPAVDDHENDLIHKGITDDKETHDVGTIDRVLMSNDANKHCPGDLVFDHCHKVPSSFGTRKSNIFASLKVEDREPCRAIFQ